MFEASARPRRKRLSWESRCAVVAVDRGGCESAAGRGRCGASRATAIGSGAASGRVAGRRSGSALDAAAAATAAAGRGWSSGSSPRGRRSFGPLRLARDLSAPGLDDRQGAAPARHLALAATGGEPRCARRYERERAGELLHVDTKKLGRFWTPGKRFRRRRRHRNRDAGWQHLHVAIDDHSRLAYAELLPSERADDCAASSPAPSPASATTESPSSES